jgi:hypothetical protein
MRHLSHNVNHNVYETGLTFGKIAPLEQAHLRRTAKRGRGAFNRSTGRDVESSGCLIGQGYGDLVSPNVPTGREFSRVEFEPGTGTSPLDHLSDDLRFLAMTTARGLDPTARR